MTGSLCLTIHNRPIFISELVSDSFRHDGNQIDEAVVVLDRPISTSERGARDAYSHLSCPVKFPLIEGPVEWKNPARAWNTAFKESSGDFLFCISSETIQYPGNVRRALEFMNGGSSVLYGRVWDSFGEPYCCSGLCRPLGTIMMLPRSAAVSVGYDEAYMNGLAYEDHDFSARLWEAGLDFIFDDGVTGVHIAHPRDSITDYRGLMLKAKNADLAATKYGRSKNGDVLPWWEGTHKRLIKKPGITIWSHR